MQKLKSIFSPRKIFVWLTLFLLAVTSPELAKPAMSKTEAIVTALCVEKEEGEIKIASTVLTPLEGKKADYKVYTGSGRTLGEAVDNVSLSLGKLLSFAQCEIMAFGDNLCQDGVMPALDFMTRTKKVGSNAILINFSGDVNDFANSISTLNTDKSLKLQEILTFSRRYILWSDSNIEAFYKGYFSDISLGIMPHLKLEKTEQNTAIEVQAQNQSSASSSSESSSSSSKSQQKQYFVNDGSMAVFKNGTKVLNLLPEQVKKATFFVNDEQKGTLIVNNVNDHLYNNASVVLNVLNKSSSAKANFKNGAPTMQVDVSFSVTVEEVDEETPTDKFLTRNREFLTDRLIASTKQQVKQDMLSMVEFCKEHQLDLLGVYKQFYHTQYKPFKAYLNEVGKKNYLNDIEFEISVEIDSAY